MHANSTFVFGYLPYAEEEPGRFLAPDTEKCLSSRRRIATVTQPRPQAFAAAETGATRPARFHAPQSCFSSGRFTLLRRLHHQIIRQFEAHDRFRRYIDIPVSGQSRHRGSGAATRQTAHQQTNAARGHATHQHP